MLAIKLLAILILLAGFASASAQSRRGKASFYSKRATGARSASGERIHHDSLTCAHRTYPFGTRLKVTNLRNGKSIIVRVTDRGPHHKGRVIDLSYGAARELGMLSQGIAMVEIERVEKTKVPYRDDPEMGMPEFEFDFSKISLPNVPTMPTMPNKPTMPNMHNKPNKPTMPNMHNRPTKPTVPTKPTLPAEPTPTETKPTHH